MITFDGIRPDLFLILVPLTYIPIYVTLNRWGSQSHPTLRQLFQRRNNP